MRLSTVGAVVAVTILAGCSSGAGDGSSTVTVTKTVGGDEPVSEAQGEGGSTVTPKPSDFTLKLKILSKQCYEGAGCNVEFRVVPEYRGEDLPGEQTTEVTYKVSGTDSTYTNTFTMKGEEASVQESEPVSTPTTKDIAAEVTDVSVLN